MKVKALAAALMFGAAMSGQASALTVAGAWIMTPPPSATTAAAYLSIDGDAGGDRLLSVSCDCAARAELHEMSMNNSVMAMRPLPYGAAVPPGGLRMQPNGIHVMLTGLSRALRDGDQVELRLTFRSAGVLNATATVRRH